MNNPFNVKSPEQLSAQDIASLFVDVFSDFPRLLANEHTFIHGPRGTGKSIMLRYLEPIVQMEAGRVNIPADLTQFSIHIPIKAPSYSLTEFDRLNGSAYWLLAEHYLICNFLKKILISVRKLLGYSKDGLGNEWSSFNNSMRDILYVEIADNQLDVDVDYILGLIDIERKNIKKYLELIQFEKELKPYTYSLFSYEDTFLPCLELIKNLSFTPNGPIFLSLDDVDNLPIGMQKIINTWVSYRSTEVLCMKLSTQLRYKTWRTIQGILIERVHDFSEIDISTVYTSKASHYNSRIKSIVKKRIELKYGRVIEPDAYFPKDDKQEEALEKIRKKIKDDWNSGVSRVSKRVSDDVTRYTFSEYMKELSKGKGTNTYIYCGLDTLINISSGVVRSFLEPAARMYSEVQAVDGPVTHIPVNVQDTVIKSWSEELMISEFDKLSEEPRFTVDESAQVQQQFTKLKTLINSIGMCFQQKILSSDSERRLLSFMITDNVTDEIGRVLSLAVELGFLSKRSISSKEGLGRKVLYTINRRLTPFFKLDPSGYAAYLSITPDLLKIAMINSNQFIRLRLKDSSVAQNSEFSLNDTLDFPNE